MNIKVINAGNCMLCGKPIKIIPTKDNDLFPSVFFCPKCEKKAKENKLKAESEEVRKYDKRANRSNKAR